MSLILLKQLLVSVFFDAKIFEISTNQEKIRFGYGKRRTVVRIRILTDRALTNQNSGLKKAI